MQHSIQSFKLEIQQMFQKSFQSLNQKNQLNKNILSNLLQSANNQEQQINQLNGKLERIGQVVNSNSNNNEYGNINNNNNGNNNNIKSQIQHHQQQINNKFSLMMSRLSLIQQNINNSKKSLQSNLSSNKSGEQKIDKMIYQLQSIIKQQNPQQNQCNQSDQINRQQLLKQIQQFQSLLKSKIQKQRQLNNTVQFYHKTSLQPLNTFETKITLHNKANQQILKQKLSSFTDKLKKLQKKVQQTKWMMSSQINKANEEQGKIIDEMNNLEIEIGKLRYEMNAMDQNRKQVMQSNALTLDNVVQEMLIQSKKLEIRVESLKKGYQGENQKIKNLITNQKMTL